MAPSKPEDSVQRVINNISDGLDCAVKMKFCRETKTIVALGPDDVPLGTISEPPEDLGWAADDRAAGSGRGHSVRIGR